MKRLPMLLLTLALLSAALLAGAAVAIPAAGQHLGYTETVLLGRSEEAQGLELSLTTLAYTAEGDTLRWDSTLTLPAAPRSVLSFSGAPPHTYSYFSMNLSLPQTDLELVTREEPAGGITGAFQQLYREHPLREGETVSATISLSDYEDVFPLDGYLNYGEPHGWFSWNTRSVAALPLSEAERLFQEHFPIPFSKAHQMTISISRIGGELNYGWAPSPSFTELSICSAWVMNGQAAYFSLRRHTPWGDPMDTSRIPGGYGVYRVDYQRDPRRGMRLEPTAITTLFGLDEGLEVSELWLSDEDTRLHVLARGEPGVVYLMADPDSGRILRRVSLHPDPEAVLQCIPGPDFVAAVTDHTAVTLFAPDESGQWVAQFSAPLLASGQADHSSGPLAMAWDGVRLAVAARSRLLPEGVTELLPQPEQRPSSCGFVLAVYDRDGPRYLGRWDSSLDVPAVLAPHSVGVWEMALRWT